MAASYDRAYKDLFSHPEIIKELITEFLPPEISSYLDLDSLAQHTGHYITPLNKEKIQDVVWSAEFLQLNRQKI